MICFVINSPPVAQGRGRSVCLTCQTRGKLKGIRVYDPKKSGQYKSLVAQKARLAMKAHGVRDIMCGPLRVEIHVYFAVPKSKERKRTPVKAEHHAAKPDCDNLAKAVLDGMEGICFLNDSQVADLRVKKVRLDQGQAARTSVMIEEMEPL